MPSLIITAGVYFCALLSQLITATNGWILIKSLYCLVLHAWWKVRIGKVHNHSFLLHNQERNFLLHHHHCLRPHFIDLQILQPSHDAPLTLRKAAARAQSLPSSQSVLESIKSHISALCSLIPSFILKSWSNNNNNVIDSIEFPSSSFFTSCRIT